MDDEEQEELRCTGSDVEIEEYTDTEESPYVAYQAGSDKLFDTDRENWQKLRFLATLLSVVVSVTVLVISYPLYLESVAAVSSAYTGKRAPYTCTETHVHARCSALQIAPAEAHMISKLMCNAKLSGPSPPGESRNFGISGFRHLRDQFLGIANYHKQFIYIRERSPYAVRYTRHTALGISSFPKLQLALAE